MVSDELTDTPTCNKADAMMSVVIADWAHLVFSYLPFLVKEEWLEKDEWIARGLFKKMGLGDSDDDNEQKTTMWITKNYKNDFRGKHRKRRNNLHQSIKNNMESK